MRLNKNLIYFYVLEYEYSFGKQQIVSYLESTNTSEMQEKIVIKNQKEVLAGETKGKRTRTL